MEKAIKRRGASYVFWLEDDWFSDDSLRPAAVERMKIADLVIAVTPTLEKRIRELFPGSRVITLEEPIDTDRLQPKGARGDRQKPLVVWGGRVWNLKKLLTLNGVLERTYREFPFDLRIITGTRKPDIRLSIPWEWRPYDRTKEAEYNAGAVAGLAPLEDVTYNQCKGNYKIKTYMAMGVPPLTSPVGYNHHLIRHGETGFMLNSEEEWESTLRLLMKDPLLGAKVGAAARADIIKRYSYRGLMPIWAEALSSAFPTQLPAQIEAEAARFAQASVSAIHRNNV
jgi:glycosyltransferase involved in cell wall biosynthesis